MPNIIEDDGYLLSTLEKIRQKLLDHTRRNRLLNYKETARDIAVIDEMADFVFEDLVLNDVRFNFSHYNRSDCEGEEANLVGELGPDRTLPETQTARGDVDGRYRDNILQTPFSSGELERRLRKLYSEHKTLIEETGANSLFLAMGFLEWSDSEDAAKPMLSPLLLVPVRLNRQGTAGQAKYDLSFDDEALDSNYSLIDKLRKNFDLNIPELGEEEKPESYWGRILDAVRGREEWRVRHEMALGLFKFNRQVMWHDLDPSRWPDHSPLVHKDVLRRILLGPREGQAEPGQLFKDYPQDSAESEFPDIKLIRDADSSQFSSLVDSLTCEGGLVIEGPPGTGKSQTITNLIATALDEGLSVLFVAEKMAALEVVYSRLDQSGLALFCLQLHGLKTSKKDLLASVSNRIAYQAKASDDLAKKETQLSQSRAELVECSKVLSRRIGPDEVPLYDVIWRIERLGQELPEDIDDLGLTPATDISYEHFLKLKNQLDDLGNEWSAIPKDARAGWLGFMPVRYVDRDGASIREAVDLCAGELGDLNAELCKLGAQDTAAYLFELERLLSLEKTSPSQTLKDIPIGVDENIISRVVKHESVDDFRALISDIDDYLGTVKSVNETFDYSDNDSNNYAELLRQHSSRLAGVAVQPELEINQLEGESEVFSKVVRYLAGLSEDSSYVLGLTNQVSRTIADYIEVTESADGLMQGPIELSLHSTPTHVNASVTNYLSQAKENHSRIDSQVEELDMFAVSRVNSSEELEDDIDCIESNVGRVFAVFNGRYRQAKRRIRAVLSHSTRFKKSQEFVNTLRQLHKLKCEIEGFENSPDFSRGLGSLFCGIATDWAKLEAVIECSQKLKEEYGSENARNILVDWDAHVDKATGVKEALNNALDEISRFKNSHPFPDGMWDRPALEIISTVTPWVETIAKASTDLTQPWCRSSATLAQAAVAVKTYKKSKSLERAIEQLGSFELLLSGTWDKERTDVGKLRLMEEWIDSTLSVPGMDIELLGWLFDGSALMVDRYASLHSRIKRFSGSLFDCERRLSKRGDVDQSLWRGGESGTVEQLLDKLHVASDTVSSLSLMTRWANTSDNVQKKGCVCISEFVTRGKLVDRQCGMAYEYHLYKKLYSEAIASNTFLSEFSATKYQNMRDRFSALDSKIMEVNAQKIASKLASLSIPTGVGSGPVKNFTQKRLLVHEANKKRAHIPIRQLVRRSGEALQSLKPCFLMSPLSVAQYLAPGDIHFDLVVMDEASQMRPEDALGAIARASKAVIVGDPKQLPPSSFFDSSASESEEDEATAIDDTESILDVCLKQFPFRRLRWHYRSEHESLIQFSNDQFYSGDLIVFPSPKPDTRDYGVHYNFIDSPSYKKGRNRREAEVVVENIMHHYQHYGDRSLGVAAFNKAQAEEISILLDRARQKDPATDELISAHDANEAFFVKNLENVQGDERDVIFISTTYGPEEPGGPVAQRFGPINSDLGWRRLNVIATRAKQRVEVFTSMRPTDIRIGESSKRGARALRDYLEYAQTGKVTEKGVRTGKEPDSDFEISVMNLISHLGYECDPQVGVSGFYIDIGVRNPDRPGEYLLGIECDGATYHSSVSVRDRDRLRQEILESKGWSIHRIWSTNWFHMRPTEIDSLKQVIQSRLDEDRRRYISNPELIEAPEIVTEAEFATDDEIEIEEQEEGVLLEEALERFWEQNIRHQHSDRTKSILSEKMITVLVNARPTNRDEWFRSIPIDMRQTISPDEGEFRQDIFDIIEEYELV